jgi:Ca2+-binding RTX toxin-like protein
MRQHEGDRAARPVIGGLRRWAPVAAAAAFAAQALAGTPAYAATGTTVSSQGQLRVDAQNGIENDIKVSLTNTTFRVSDRDVVIAGTGCTSITRNLAECEMTGGSVSINSGDLDDAVTAPIALPVFASVGVGNDTVTTGAGDDTISGLFGADTIAAGGGQDKIFGHQDADTIDGGAGNDTINGGASADVMAGGAGTDLVDYAGSTPVTVTIDDVANDGPAGELDDVRTDVEQVRGSSGDDTITGSDLATVANKLIGSNGDDVLLGLAGHDELLGDKGSDTLQGGANDDRLDGGADADELSGGAGTGDEADYTDRDERVVVDLDDVADDGTPATLQEPGEGDNVRSDVEDLLGGAGQDRLTGSAVANFMSGGGGVDTFFGGGGADLIFGDGEADSISGEAGDDQLNGGGGDDLLLGGDGADVMDGGAGTDEVNYVGKTPGEPVTANLDGLANDGETGEGDRITTTVEDVTGGDGGDTLSGDQFANVLDGGFGGNDTLNGLAGNDTLDGGNGNDALNCGADSDVADGGAQLDTATQCEQMFNIP